MTESRPVFEEYMPRKPLFQTGHGKASLSCVVVAVETVPLLIFRYPSRKSAAESTDL